MTDFQEKIQTGILTLCFHSRHLAFPGLVVIKGRCATLCCKLKFSAIYMSSHSWYLHDHLFLDGRWDCRFWGGACFALNKIHLCRALPKPTPLLVFGYRNGACWQAAGPPPSLSSLQEPLNLPVSQHEVARWWRLRAEWERHSVCPRLGLEDDFPSHEGGRKGHGAAGDTAPAAQSPRPAARVPQSYLCLPPSPSLSSLLIHLLVLRSMYF